jgi:hypothetical protein
VGGREGEREKERVAEKSEGRRKRERTGGKGKCVRAWLSLFAYVGLCVGVSAGVCVLRVREPRTRNTAVSPHTHTHTHTHTQRRQRSDIGRMRGVEEDACQRNRGEEMEHQIRSHLRATNHNT